ncbi:AAA family ATPase [Hymenobacter guriensis]|uniref:AAA family ATPase n=1 Tax=Hymenobacter guriensis TaxID=2793065 RepID=A0ABS0L3P3_9BACT|nr:AAA family ATPase [Hymenobacter guriensis]MBG8553997.1 AAA family ATPase [Hymenobacter guriensis]
MPAKNRVAIPHITHLRVKNYRALRDLELKDITPLTVFLGPNGSGKSTVFDVFAFLSECFDSGLRKAWDKRNRMKELRTRGGTGPIEIEIKYHEGAANSPVITYHLSIDETERGPIVAEEWLKWRRGSGGKPFKFLDFKKGTGQVISGDSPDIEAVRIDESLAGPDILAVNALGQLNKHPRVVALRKFITGWYLSYLSVSNAQRTTESGPQERLSSTGDNLPNVIQHLKELYPERLEEIVRALAKRVPRLESVQAKPMDDGRLLLTIRDAPFEEPILAKFASDGTLKMLAYLTLLYDPQPPQLIAIEEPENQLHPMLIQEFAEECLLASTKSQILISTHSPFLLNAMAPEQVWIFYRDVQGYSQAIRADKLAGVNEFVQSHALLGDLWMEGRFGIGDPRQPNKTPRLRPELESDIGHESTRKTR